VGRLDAESTGLILLTNDGAMANHLTHPRYGVPKQYEVVIRGRLAVGDVVRLKKGLYLAQRPRNSHPLRTTKAAMEAVRIVGRRRDHTRGDQTVLSVTLREGRNREIRRMLAQLGYNVRRLQRVAIGPLRLGGLATGQWRPLRDSERRALITVARLAAQKVVMAGTQDRCRQ
jgi:pseudouridine synthase